MLRTERPATLRPALRRQVRRLLLATAVGLMAVPAWAIDLTELMALMAQRPAGDAQFEEQRFVSGLDQPLRSSGTLSFKAPGRLARVTLKPREESFVVDGDKLTLERSGRVRHVALDSVPELATMVAAIRGTLMGDGTVLQRHFQAQVSGSAGQWSLTLQPLDAKLAAIVKQMQMQGTQADLREVEVRLADGDRSVMTIKPVPAARAASATP